MEKTSTSTNTNWTTYQKLVDSHKELVKALDQAFDALDQLSHVGGSGSSFRTMDAVRSFAYTNLRVVAKHLHELNERHLCFDGEKMDEEERSQEQMFEDWYIDRHGELEAADVTGVLKTGFRDMCREAYLAGLKK